ncbi:unnamed protein product [Closterium sp. NIES-53]
MLTPPCCPHHPAARRPAARAARLLPALLRAALLAGALLPVRRPAGSRTAAHTALPAPPCCCPPCCVSPCWPTPCCPRAALLPARRPAARAPPCWQPHCPAGSRTALPCPRAALLAAALPCVGCVPLFPSRTPPLPALRASLVLERSPACVLPCGSRATLLCPLWLLSVFSLEDLVTHLRTSDTHYRAALPAEFLDRNPPPMYITLYFMVTRLPDSLHAFRDHFLALDPTDLTVNLLEKHLPPSLPIGKAYMAVRISS